jgi:VanZ family protein
MFAPNSVCLRVAARRRFSWAAASLFIAAGYSALDETHQSFVASRTASVWDSLLDSTGAFVALLVVYLFFRLYRSAPSA